MVQEKTVSSHIVSDLEVSELHGNSFIDLPEAYTQKTMPITQKNIQNPNNLSQVTIPKKCQYNIDAHIGLLIGTDAAKVMNHGRSSIAKKRVHMQ